MGRVRSSLYSFIGAIGFGMLVGCSPNSPVDRIQNYRDTYTGEQRSALCKEDARNKIVEMLREPTAIRRTDEDGKRYFVWRVMMSTGHEKFFHVDSRKGQRFQVTESSYGHIDPDVLETLRQTGFSGLYPVTGASLILQVPLGQQRWYEWLVQPHTPHGIESDVEFAVDIAAPIGAEVRAFRGGVVVQTEDRHGDYGCGKTRYPTIGNSIYIVHPDGTEARYAHLQQGSVKVAVGDHVDEGQVVAAVGYSGAIRSGPHLHIQVGGVTEEGLMSVPLQFYTKPSQTPWTPRYGQFVSIPDREE